MAALPFLSARVLGRVREFAGGGAFDLVGWSTRCSRRVLLDAVPGGVRLVLSLHDVGETQYASMARGAGSRADRAGYRMKSAALRRLERRRAPRFDRVTVVSADDGAALAAIAPAHRRGGRAERRRCAARAAAAEEPESGAVLAFVGNLGYAPNAQAAGRSWPRRCCRECESKCRTPRPGSPGPTPAAAVLELGSLPGVRLLGRVPDVADVHRAARVVVVPLALGEAWPRRCWRRWRTSAALSPRRSAARGWPWPTAAVLLADGSAALAEHHRQGADRRHAAPRGGGPEPGVRRARARLGPQCRPAARSGTAELAA